MYYILHTYLIIILSVTQLSQSEIEDLLKRGVYSYLKQPVKPEILLKIVETASHLPWINPVNIWECIIFTIGFLKYVPKKDSSLWIRTLICFHHNTNYYKSKTYHPLVTVGNSFLQNNT